MKSRRLALQERIAFLYKLRLRAFAVLLGLTLAAIGVISMVSAPAWPFVAGAVAIAAVAVNSVASRLTKPVCMGCGTVIQNEPVGQYGVVCPSCGTISSPVGVASAGLSSALPSEQDRGEPGTNEPGHGEAGVAGQDEAESPDSDFA